MSRYAGCLRTAFISPFLGPVVLSCVADVMAKKAMAQTLGPANETTLDTSAFASLLRSAGGDAMPARTKVTLFFLLLLILTIPATAATGPTVYVVYNNSPLLTALDSATWTEVSSVAMTLPGRTVINATGLARHPLTGELYALLSLSGQTPRELVVLNPQTGVASDSGLADDGSGQLLFADITFASDGTLYGVTGAGSSLPQCVFQLDTTNGHAIFLASMSYSRGGATLAFHASTGVLYHGTTISDYNGDYSILESIDPALIANGTTFVSNNAMVGATALSSWIPDWFIWAGFGDLYLVRTDGVVTYLKTFSSAISGIAVAGAVPSSFELTVTTSGTGTGTVISNPAGILCPGVCTASFGAGASVMLTATPDSGNLFGEWQGQYCTPSVNNARSCTVVLPANTTVNATFSVLLTPPAGSLYMISPASTGPLLRLIDPGSGNTLYSVPMTTSGSSTVLGGIGLAKNPVDGKLYAVLNVQGMTAGQLATTTAAGEVTILGPADDGSGLIFADLAFAPDGTLYGVTSGTVPHGLFRLNTATGAATFVRSIAATASGGYVDGIAFNPNDQQIYYASATYDPDQDWYTPLWEKLDPLAPNSPPELLPSPNIGYSGVEYNAYNPAATALLHWTGNTFLWANYNRLNAVGADGSVQFLSRLPDVSSGLAPAATLPSTFTLEVSVSSGTGTVTSDPPGIDCPTTCSASFAAGTSVLLTATAGSGFILDRWIDNEGSKRSITNRVGMFSNRSVQAVFAAAPIIDLRVTLSGPASAVVGDTITYTVIVFNDGGGQAAANVVLTYSLPAGFSFVSATSGRGCSHANGVVTCRPPFALGSGYFYVDIATSTIATGQWTNSASVTADIQDTNTANNSATLTTIVGSRTDTTPPNVSLTSPVDGSTVSGTAVNIAAMTSDNVGVVGVQFKLDGVNLGVEITAQPYLIVLDTTRIANGNHNLTATSRDATGNVGVSATVAITVNNSVEFGLSLPQGSPNSGSISAGGTANFTLNVAPTAGFTGSVSFTCTGVPQAATCTVTPNPAPVSGHDTTVVTVAIRTTTQSAALRRSSHPFGPLPPYMWAIALVSPLLFLRIDSRCRRRVWPISILFLLIVLGGCGGGGGRSTSVSSPQATGTPAGKYTITVTGATGSVTHNFAFTVTVN